jgi:hypothetical protein
LQVLWIGAEDTKQEVRGSSAGAREVRFFRAKNCVTCALRHATVWLSSGPSPGIKKTISYFLNAFFNFA